VATTAPARTFILTSPHVTGKDVLLFQRELNRRFAKWKTNRRVLEDKDYGTDTRKACRQVCKGLGIDHRTAMAHGVTPELRKKIRDPRRRTPEEIARAKSPAVKAFKRRLRKKFNGTVIQAPGANKPGKPISAMTLEYVGKMAAILGKPIVVTTGTNHDKFTSNGSISDHFTGHAVDIGMAGNGGGIDSPIGDAIMAAALQVGGFSKADAKAIAQQGALKNIDRPGQRIQCIWKFPDHHDHVHVGVRPA
jgi:hypothetical protein